MGSVQYRMQLSEEEAEELNQMAEEFGDPSGPMVAATIIRRYKSFHRAVKEAERELVDFQFEELKDKIQTMLKAKGKGR